MDTDSGLIRDQAQVRAMCKWAADYDNQGELGQFFDKPKSLNRQYVFVCMEEEGWVLGAV